MTNAQQVCIGDYAFDSTDQLGRGSFAEVFRGRHTGDGTIVAIKRIAQSKVKRASNRRLLDREISVLRRVDHENIVKLYDCLQTSDHICLIMEYCDGGDLAGFISDKAPLNEDLIASITRQLGSALKYLRDLNIVHRDLKPHNILLHGDMSWPTLKLADFGFARVLEEEELTATFCGSPLYMAPEVLEGDNYGPQADLWSVGVIIYSCLTGKTPFRAPNIKALKAKLKQRPKIAYPKTVSRDLRDLLEGLLQIDPSLRYTFDELFRHTFVVDRFAKEEETTKALADAAEGQAGGSTSRSAATPGSSYVMVDDDAVKMNILADMAAGDPNVTLDHLNSASVANPLSHAGSQFSERLDPNMFVNYINDLVRPALIIMKFARHRTGQNVDHLASTKFSLGCREGRYQAETLMLMAKAMDIFRRSLRAIRRAVQVNPPLLQVPKVKLNIENLRKAFNECLMNLEGLTDSGAVSQAELLEDLQTADEILFDYCISLCREAAGDERSRQLQNALALYERAIVLFNELIQGAPTSERPRLNQLIMHAEKRRQILLQRIGLRMADFAEAAPRLVDSPAQADPYGPADAVGFDPTMPSPPSTAAELHMRRRQERRRIRQSSEQTMSSSPMTDPPVQPSSFPPSGGVVQPQGAVVEDDGTSHASPSKPWIDISKTSAATNLLTRNDLPMQGVEQASFEGEQRPGTPDSIDSLRLSLDDAP